MCLLDLSNKLRIVSQLIKGYNFPCIIKLRKFTISLKIFQTGVYAHPQDM